jgi:hypothetical protein
VGTYLTIHSDPVRATNHHFRVGTYVHCSTDGFYYRVAPDNATDHDAVTMFDVKLYVVDPADYPSYTSAAGSTIEGITIDGTSVDGDPADGLWLRTSALVRNVTIENFSRDGLAVIAAVPLESKSSPQIWGNANLFSVDGVEARYNGIIGCHAE